jgi:large repetitive protein
MKAPKLPTAIKAIVLFNCLFLFNLIAQAQVAVPFTVRYENNLKGDMTLIANSIVNRQTSTEGPNVPYNTLGNTSQYNDNFNMLYVDIDSDTSTFSSSSAVLTLPNGGCNKIVYAGLYWSATYRFNTGYSTSAGDGDGVRFSDFNQVKLKLPGGAYQDITGQILFDGFTDPNFIANSPYACYADITNLVTGLANPEGEYTIANIRATQGFINGGGVSGGWTIFFVYENPQMPGKFITSYDGFAGVRAAIGTTDIEYSGFTTLPPPFPVRAQLASAALEGDNRITGDQLRFKASTNPTFTDLSGALKPVNNFFNSRITLKDVEFLDRTPNSRNTLGYDSDIITIPNPGNLVLPNNSTAATLQITSTQDTYFMFFNAFNVDVIEPDINLVKTVQDLAGTDIGGANVTLGQFLDYVITFQNIGNDDSTNSVIRDILPVNTSLISVDLSGAPGVTYTYNPATKELLFSIPDNLLEIGDPIYTIRIRVQVATTCSELEDACSNIIQNQAYTTYQGVLNSNVISDDPSFAGLDSCGFGQPGPANFLVDIDDCIFSTNEVLCGSSIVLTAANDYIAYLWTNSNGDVIGTNQSVTVSSVGTYTVVNTAAPPCIGITQTFNVTLFGATQTNPIIPFADEVVVCPNDGEELPLIFLCGVNDSRLLQISNSDAVSIIWEVLNEASCPPVGVDDCANKNAACNWTTVGTGPNYNATTAGQYRVTLNYQNGCFTRFYFNVFANLLDVQYTTTNIICNTPGSITITNLPSDYEFQLVNQTTNTILVPYQNNPIFTVAQAGVYLVQIRQIGVVDGCLFEVPNIGIQQNNFQVNVITQNASCNGQGSIRLQALNVLPQYYFTISGPVSISVGPVQDNDYTFNNLNPGTYTVTVTTDDGCSFTDTVTITPNTLNLTAQVSQHISCNQGNIQMSSGGGQPPYVYAIYSYNGVLQNPTAADYQTSVIFDIDFGGQGTYVFIMVDNNNCFTLSNPVTIDLIPNVTVNTTVQNVSCNGGSNGSINFAISNANGYNISYELLDGNGNVIYTGASGLFTGLAAGDYTVNLIQSKGNRTCVFTYNFTITEPDPIVGNAVVIQDYTCVTNSGSIGIDAGSVSGGVPPYQYSIDGITFGAATTFTGLTAGTYTITIRDANNCIATTNAITFAPLNQITDLNFSASAVTCPALSSNITVTAIGGNAPFVYEIIAPSGQAINNGNNPTFNGLAPGTYTFLVTDNNGCFYQENYTIYPITPITVVGVLVANVVCLGDSNGALTYTVNSPNPYNYTVVNGLGTTVASASNSSLTTIPLTGLPASTYTITVTDTTTNCTATSAVTIAAPTAALAINITTNPITCLSNGNVTATATGGWGSNQYTLTQPNATVVGPQTSGSFGNLSQTGTYTISVTDANGCIVSTTFTLTTPPTVTASIAASSDICYDTSNASTLVVSVSGGTAPFVYSINGGPNQNSNTFANLTPGSYTIVVTDSFGCTATVSQIITPQLLASTSIVKGLDCTASPDALIETSITGGLAPFIYQVAINGGAFGSSTAVIGTTLSYQTATAGTYQFLFTDAQGCTFTSGVYTIQPITLPSITSVIQTQNILCHGEASGAISITLDNTVGTAPFVISVVNTTTGVNYGNQTVGLTAGNYVITVTDANSCSDSETITITQPDLITYNVTSVPITCDSSTGTNLGQITIQNVTGGVAPFTYYLTNNFGDIFTPYLATTGEDYTFTIVNFGIYQVDIIDSNGCSVVTSNIIIASPPNDLEIDISTATVDCVSGGTAVVTVTTSVIGGPYQFGILDSNTAPYSGSFIPSDVPGGSTATFTGLIPGVTYTFVVFDQTTNCYFIKSADLPIQSPSNLNAVLDVVSNVSCTGNVDGNVSFTFSNYDAGATAVTYEIFNLQFNVSTGITGTTTPLLGGPVTVSNFGLLGPGTYYILFTEIGGAFNGCSTASASFTISQSTNLLQVTASISQNDNCNLNAGQITAVGQFGTPPYQFQIINSGDTPPTASTWAGSSNSVFNVEAGNYIIYIKDANDCIQATPSTIIVVSDPEPVITASISNQCNTPDGSFIITVNRTSAGIAPYSYSFNGGAFQSQAAATFTYTNLTSGTYTIEIQDANGCGNLVSVTILPALNASPVIDALPTCADNDGVISVIPSGGSGNYEFTLQNNLGVTIQGPQASSTFNGLAAGDYTVIVTDTTSSCSSSASVTLSVPAPVVFTTSTSTVSCNGGSDGSITIVLDASNTNPPYVFSVTDGINPPIVQNNGFFTGLPAGTYTVTVTSDRDCQDVQIIQITEPSLLAISATATSFVCDALNTVQTSVITVTVSDDAFGNPSGTAPYNYSIDGTNYFPTNTFNVVDNGTVQNITVYVKDANNCIQTTSVIINPLPTITAVSVTQTTAITCINDAIVTIGVVGGSGDFTYELLPSGPVQVNNPIFALTTPGSYVFQVTDNVTGCYSLTTPFEIAPFDTIDVVITANSPVTCFGDTDGTVTIDVTGYSGAYSYEVQNNLGATIASGNGNTSVNPFTITGLLAGNHQVTITATDSPFCTAISATTTVGSPDSPLQIVATETANVTCDNNSGVIVATATGGWGSYQYQLVNNTTATTVYPYGTISIFENLTAGNYTVFAQDAGGCIVQTTVILIQPAFISATITSTNASLLCHGDTNASVSAVSVTGGQGSYQYILNIYDAAGTTIVFSTDAQINNTFTGLGVGIYSITITDGWNCDFTTNTVTITEPSQIVASLSLTDTLTCTTLAEVTISATGGTPPYLYSTDGVTYTTTTIYPVGAGTYQFYVTDANNCTAVLSNQVTILPVPALELNLNLNSASINCFGEATATIFADATGGLGSYNYTLLDNANNVLAGPQTSGSFLNLASGQYVVTVTSGDCSATSSVITITDPQPLVVSSINITNVLCFGGENGAVEIIASGGTGIIQYAISPNLNQFFNTNTFTNLAPGNYDIIVQDQSGCFVLLNIDIIEPAELVADVTNVVQNLCLGDDDGSFDMLITGGTPPYSTSLNNPDPSSYVQDQLSFTGLAGGQAYFIFVKDANDCETVAFVSLDVPVEVIPSVTIDYNCTGNVPGNTVTVSVNADVVNDVTYSLDGGPYQVSNIFQNLTSGTHTIDVQHTNGCIKSVTFDIDAYDPILLTVTSAEDVLCNAGNTGSITVNATGGSGAIQYAISPNLTVFTSQNVYTNLTAGNYTIIAQDALGCTVSETVTINEPSAIGITLGTIAQELCTNDANGSITINVTGGVAPYSTSLNNTTSYVPNQFTFSNLVGGQTYTIYVRDANNCDSSIQVTLDAPVTINPTAAVTYSCTGNVAGNTVTISVDSSVAGSVTYSLDGGAYQASNVFQNLTPGSHTVNVQHTNGCIKPVTFTIDAYNPIVLTLSSVIDVLCNGGNTGSITVNATGGSGAIQYAISPNLTVFTSQNVYTNLVAGSYTIIAQDAIGCTVSETITINEPTAIGITLGAVTQELCTNDANGSITINVTGGVAPYSTSLNNTTSYVPNQFTFSNLIGGQTYTIYVRDANNCVSSIQVTLDAPVTINPTAAVTYACTGNVPGNTVTITVNSSVVGAVTYSLDGGAYQASNVFQNLTPGSHTVNVQHTNGCIKPVTFTVNPTTPITLNLSSVVNVACNGANTGSITATTTGGTGAIQYAISPNLTVFTSLNIFNNLAAGTYTVIAQDAIGCSTSQTVTITQPNAVVITPTTVVQELCSGDANGSITINVTGGVAPYATSLNNTFNFIPNQFTFTNLIGGQTYTIFVRDANNCITSIPVTLNPSVNINPSVAVNYNCNANTVGNTVTVTVDASVASSVQYALDGGTYQNSATFTDVAVGPHTITVLHSNGCQKTVSFVINPTTPLQATFSTVHVTCFGLTNGSITVNPTGGTAPYQYAISPNLTTFVSSNVFNNLAAGTYSVIVRDAIGCQVELIIKLDQPAQLNATIDAVTQDLCVGDSDGAITIAVSGGTAPYATSLTQNGNYVANQFTFENLLGGQTYTVYVRDANNCQTSVSITLDPFVDIQAQVAVDYGCLSSSSENTVTVTVNSTIAGSVTYSLDGMPFQNSNIFTNLSNGSHTVMVVHTNGCFDEVTFTISNQTPLSLTLVESAMNQITATAAGGSGVYTYYLNGQNFGTQNVFQIFATGTYVVQVVDSYGCIAEESIFITFIDIDIPNFFTPNDDGENDLWTPTNLDGFPNIRIYVHDRYGRNITQFGQNGGWDGTYNGKPLPTGDYWYTITLQNGRKIVGNVTLYR